MKLASTLIAGVLALTITHAQSGTSILFVGNSFTFAAGSPVRFYRAETVTDLNNEGSGGVPALFKSFTQVKALQQVAFDELAAAGAVAAAPLVLPQPVNPERCAPAH